MRPRLVRSHGPVVTRPDERIRRMVGRLGSWRRSVQAQAQEEVRGLGPEGVRLVASEIERAARALEREHRMGCAAVAVLWAGHFMVRWWPWAQYATCVALTMVVVRMLMGNRRSRAVTAMSVALAEGDASTTVGMLLAALPLASDSRAGDRMLRRLVSPALMAIAPADAAPVVSQHAAALWTVVDRTRDAALGHHVIAMFACAGTEEDIARLQRLRNAAWGFSPPLASRADIRLAADQAIGAIEARMAALGSTRYLVRAAEAPGNSGDTLLRPARGVAGGDEDRLVRAATPPVRDGANATEAGQVESATADTVQQAGR